MFQKNAELQEIDDYAFMESSIKSISISPHVTKIGKGAFGFCDIEIIEFDENSELKYIDLNIFEDSIQVKIMIQIKLTERLLIKNSAPSL